MFPIPTNIKALIFDCDGTLVDTMPHHLAAWDEALKEFGYDGDMAALAGRYAGRSTVEIIEILAQENGWSLDAALFARTKDQRYKERRSELIAIPEMRQIVEQNYKQLPMIVLSGGSRENVEHALRETNLFHFFDFLITASDGLPSKAESEIFTIAAKRIGVAPSACMVFEDGGVPIEAAARAGMVAVHVDDVRRAFLDGRS